MFVITQGLLSSGPMLLVTQGYTPGIVVFHVPDFAWTEGTRSIVWIEPTRPVVWSESRQPPNSVSGQNYPPNIGG